MKPPREDISLPMTTCDDEYVYDVNGNLIKDLNKNIISITYNCLNLPNIITFADGNTITYDYDANGSKLSVAYKIGDNIAKTEYVGNKVYKNGTLSMILTEEGYITMNGTTPTNHYFLKDHQGNNRVVIGQSGTVEQVNHYYPFGGLFGEGLQDSNQPYKYNGKEFDDLLGLNMYDYGARHYDPYSGRWGTPDLLMEKYYPISPYVYVANNPVRFIDPTGMLIDDYFNGNGKYLGKDEFNTDFIRIMDQKLWDQIKRINKNGDESVNHESGVQNSTLHSKSNISEESSLAIYNHYNPTGLELRAETNAEGAGGAFSITKYTNGRIKLGIKINMEQNRIFALSDHFYEIQNMFVHEGTHFSDYKTLGYDRYAEMNKNRLDILELRAIKNQMNHPSWRKTGEKYQTSVIKYGLESGAIFPTTNLYLKNVPPRLKPNL